MLGKYLLSKWKTIITFIVMILIFILVAKLYDMPWGGCAYAIVLCSFCGLVVSLYGFYRYVQKSKHLEDLKLRKIYDLKSLPRSTDRIEFEYQQMVNQLSSSIAELTSRNDYNRSEMNDYYTMWVHQIKTPIAAMRLLLQSSSEDFDGKAEMKMELFKIEQYVEMVLQYIRLGSEQSDYVFRKQQLDPIIRENIRKYSTTFIKKKIALEYEPVDVSVLSDEKWLSFVIEQVLSNALKYTNAGKISIYMEKGSDLVLVIEDTGIGIQAEDIPRVTDRGYTGYNGRTDKKSTGIGLYLCNSIMKKLGNSMSIESEVGKGTKVKLNLTHKDMKFE